MFFIIRNCIKWKKDKIEKTETKTKYLGTETHPGDGVMKEEKFPHSRKSSHNHVCGEFWNLRGQHKWKEKKEKKTPRIHT